MDIEGFNTHRHSTNPKEKELHDKFKKSFLKPHYSYNAIDRLVFGHASKFHNPKDFLSDKEKRIVVSTIQWLGSSVGSGFLRDCGYHKEEDLKPKVED